MTESERIGTSIRRARRNRDMSVKDMAFLLQVDMRWLMEVEHGRIPADNALMVKIDQALSSHIDGTAQQRETCACGCSCRATVSLEGDLCGMCREACFE